MTEIVDVMNSILGLLDPFEATLAYAEKLLQSKSGPRLPCCQALMRQSSQEGEGNSFSETQLGARN